MCSHILQSILLRIIYVTFLFSEHNIRYFFIKTAALSITIYIKFDLLIYAGMARLLEDWRVAKIFEAAL